MSIDAAASARLLADAPVRVVASRRSAIMHPVVVVGAGPAGLAASYALKRAGIDHLVLEAGDVGQTWETLYDSLVLHTGKHMSALPGQPFSRSTPLFPSRRTFLDYLRHYAQTHALPIRTHARVVHVQRDGAALDFGRDADLDREHEREREREHNWGLTLASGEQLRARSLVWCAGIVANPQVPEWPTRDRFRGRVLHSVDYHRPDPFRDRRVLVVGVGNSGGEIAAELASKNSGVAAVAVAVRSGALVVPREIAGVPIQYVSRVTSLLPRGAQVGLQRALTAIGERVRGPSGLPRLHGARSCQNIPLIGFHLTEAIRAGRVRVRPGVQEWLEEGVRFSDGIDEAFDDVILATGYRPALEPLAGLATRDACGFARRRDRVISADQSRLYFVGQTYDARGALLNIGVDARRVASVVARSTLA